MKSVLIIDDNVDIVDSMVEGMDMFGIDVVGKAYDGLEGLEQFKKLNPDVVLLDIMMPDHDGFYLLDKIYGINPKAKVIVVSGDIKEETREKLATYELLGSFSKPIKFAELSKVINS
jgi:two-component system chemotaxis response regulator CheY